MLRVHMALPDVSRENLIDAMQRFDVELRGRPEWANWETGAGQKYAVEHNGRLYPPKGVISLATGRDRDSFSGGEQSNGYFAARGFTIKTLIDSPAGSPLAGLHDALEAILREYPAARQSGPYSKEHPVIARFEAAQVALRASTPVASRPTLQVKYSSGKGNWAAVPWIAVMDERETETTQEGRYVVFLFRSDCSGVYMTLNQGVTQPIRDLGRTPGLAQLRERAAAMRTLVGKLHERGFALTDDIQLQQEGLGRDYEASTVAHKLFRRDAIPDDAALQRDLDALLEAYEIVLSAPAAGRAWIFQANPKTFDVAGAVRALPQLTWTARQHVDDIHVGDRVYIWEAGPTAGIIATAEVVEEASVREDDTPSRAFWRNAGDLSGEAPRVVLRIDSVLETRLTRSRLQADSRFDDLPFLRAPMGTNFPISDKHRRALDEMIEPPHPDTPFELCSAFSAAIREAGLWFGAEHDTLVRCFLSSILVKPFVILTGLSGSGKTQLALKLGEWLGEGRYRVVPVRPDWTGPESLLGYEDALLPVEEDRRAWHVPDALQLILKAARDPAHPYLLILDEMNLAHVERYFADVLSGIESREDVIPNLRVDPNGYWRVPKGQPSKVAMPRNLMLVGTVNVDETTYMFSPKVLDRANTIEFRVPTEALSTDIAAVRKPVRCAPASERQLRSLLAIGLADAWAAAGMDSVAPAAALIRQVHAGLSLHGFEFGHRTYYEALRLVSLLAACGIEDTNDALDIFLLQKVLPRLHGSKRRLEPVLRSLGAFAFERRAMTDTAADLDVLGIAPSKAPLMRRTFAKIVRMMRALHANQFVSFAD